MYIYLGRGLFVANLKTEAFDNPYLWFSNPCLQPLELQDTNRRTLGRQLYDTARCILRDYLPRYENIRFAQPQYLPQHGADASTWRDLQRAKLISELRTNAGCFVADDLCDFMSHGFHQLKPYEEDVLFKVFKEHAGSPLVQLVVDRIVQALQNYSPTANDLLDFKLYREVLPSGQSAYEHDHQL